jgi:hypothetical protein
VNNGYRYLREDTYVETVWDAVTKTTYNYNPEAYESNMNHARQNLQWLVCRYAY